MSENVNANITTKTDGDYVVVARRYRPQTFSDLVGQEAIAAALSGAIRSQRIGHAYLFTGARGVGKTSTARILAKSLNCIHGPTPTPCNECEICKDISAGSDVDVIEIDGASNRGIDEIRQLRQNVSIRPARALFKIYIIDEVHMLTREAFNALLKTLEEPPEHVKFIFCTTEPGKIPITILSRCQRFDFSGIAQESIQQRLAYIATSEGVTVEPDALEILARRAAGSMRDSQSLLEQLLAFAPGRTITTADVRQMLGIVGEESLLGLLERIVAKDVTQTLLYFDTATREGVEPGTLLEQLLGVLRDAMVATAGAPPTACLYTSPAQRDRLWAVAQRWRLDTICAAMQMTDQTLGRMRYSTQSRVLAEMLVVRLCRLESLSDLTVVLERLAKGEFPNGPIVVSQTVVAADNTGPQLISLPEVASKLLSAPEPTSDAAQERVTPPVAEPTVVTDPASVESVPVEKPFSTAQSEPIPATETAADVEPISGTKSTADPESAVTIESAPIAEPVPIPESAVVTEIASTTESKSTTEPMSTSESVPGTVVTSEISSTSPSESAPTADGQPVKRVRKTSRKSTMSDRERAEKRKESLNHPMVQKARDLFGLIPESIDPLEDNDVE